MNARSGFEQAVSGRYVVRALLCLVVICLTHVGVGSSASATSPERPDTEVAAGLAGDALPRVAAHSWILADATTGEILAARDPHRQLPPASTLKVLTALALLPALDPTSEYTAIFQDVNQPGSRVGLRQGSTYRITDLLNGLLLESGNDAGSALANAYGGWEPAIERMNTEAARIGATDTVAATPNGLDRRGQLSTVHDLATIFRAALDVEGFRDAIGHRSVPFPRAGRSPIDERGTYTLHNSQRLMRDQYPGVIGAKDGYTSMAGHTFVAAAERGDTTLVFAAMRLGMSANTMAERLFDWGFAYRPDIAPIGSLPAPVPARVVDRRPAIVLDPYGDPVANQDGTLAAISTERLADDPRTDAVGAASSPPDRDLPVAAWIGAAVVVLAGILVWGLLRYRRTKPTRS